MPAALYGLTEKVFSYRPRDPPVDEVEPPKDRAFFADPEKKELLSAASKAKHLTPYIGTELIGIQLNQLTPQQKDDLALLVAEVRVCCIYYGSRGICLKHLTSIASYREALFSSETRLLR